VLPATVHCCASWLPLLTWGSAVGCDEPLCNRFSALFLLFFGFPPPLQLEGPIIYHGIFKTPGKLVKGEIQLFVKSTKQCIGFFLNPQVGLFGYVHTSRRVFICCCRSNSAGFI
jgi:hypothetical protein